MQILLDENTGATIKSSREWVPDSCAQYSQFPSSHLDPIWPGGPDTGSSFLLDPLSTGGPYTCSSFLLYPSWTGGPGTCSSFLLDPSWTGGPDSCSSFLLDLSWTGGPDTCSFFLLDPSWTGGPDTCSSFLLDPSWTGVLTPAHPPLLLILPCILYILPLLSAWIPDPANCPDPGNSLNHQKNETRRIWVFPIIAPPWNYSPPLWYNYHDWGGYRLHAH